MFTSTNTQYLTRTNIWADQLKEVLEDELFAMRYVDMITGFTDGDTYNIPSIGQAEVFDYTEGQAIRLTGMDTGNFTFTIDNYVSSGTYITDKALQDLFYSSRLVSSFVPKQHRAIMKAIEANVLAIGPTGQTASDLNTINNGWHRWVGSGTNEVIALSDFQKARYSLAKANVPLRNLVAIVDPSVEYALATLANLTSVANNPRWEGIVRDGMSTGTQFLMNVYGFDVYVSNNLKYIGAETINGKSTTVGVANLFFSAEADVLPFVFSYRQPPKVESKREPALQREEYYTTCRWGSKLYRPENLCVVITDTDQVV